MEQTGCSETSAHNIQTPVNRPKERIQLSEQGKIWNQEKVNTFKHWTTLVGRDSAVGIATRYGLDGSGIESRWGAKFSGPVQTGPGAYPASYTMGTGSFQGVKQPMRGVDHPPHLATRFKKE